jgi:hypothetical protein
LKAAVVAAVTGLIAALVAIQPASAQSPSAAVNPYERGPAPTVSSVAAQRGTFTTAEVTVPPGNGFNGGKIYYPTDTSLGTWGAIAAVPGYTARWAAEGAWMGPWLASFGFVVIGIDTNSPNDYDTARGTQLLAALDYLTQRSPVRDRVDPNSVIAEMTYEHPLYTTESVAAQKLLPTLDDDKVVFAGAYQGWGFHEDGAAAGLKAAQRLGAEWPAKRLEAVAAC